MMFVTVYQEVHPPSTGILIPVTKDDASDAKNAIGPINSEGIPILPIGTFETM
jgi:hypothetical protein